MAVDDVQTVGKQEVDWLNPTRNEVLYFCGSADTIGTAERSFPMLRQDTHEESTKGLHYSRVRNKRAPLNKHSPWNIW